VHAERLGGTLHRASPGAVPRLRDARVFEELAARLFLERSGDLTQREGLGTHTLSELAARLTRRDGARLERIDGLAAVERGRAGFFARLRAAGPHDGRLARALPVDSLPGTLARPLSATTLGRYADCPQRFFLESVLRLRALEELGDDLDERANGSLAHAALEHLFRAWNEAELFPLRGRPEEQALIAPAVDEAARGYRAAHPPGHEVLFRGRLRNLVRTLEAIWRKEVAEPPVPGLLPSGFEHDFDGLRVDIADAAPAHLTGTIDRIDRSPAGDRVAVFDYKSKKLRDLTPDLKPDSFGETSWQLPLYAAALRATQGTRHIGVHYYSLRDVKVSGTAAPDWLVFDPGTAERPTLGDRLRVLVADMRGGRFDVEPRDGACDHCRMQAACRVRARRDDNEERRP
jgi:RecB family exonuclease